MHGQWTVRFLICASALFFPLASIATAEAPSQDDVEAPSQDDVEAPSQDDVEARLLYQAGVVAYDAGRYEDALERFQRAYELSGRDALLFNIGSAAERAREDEIALDAYERFLEAEPETPLRGRIERTIARLRKELERRRASEVLPNREAALLEGDGPSAEPGPVLDFNERTAEKRASKPMGAYLSLAAGGAVFAVGSVSLAMGLVDKSRVENPAEGERNWLRDAARAYDRGPALLTTGIIALPVGAALAAVGSVMLLKSASKTEVGDPEAATMALDLGPGSVRLGGRF